MPLFHNILSFYRRGPTCKQMFYLILLSAVLWEYNVHLVVGLNVFTQINYIQFNVVNPPQCVCVSLINIYYLKYKHVHYIGMGIIIIYYHNAYLLN